MGSPEIRILVAASGSGGHLFPALLIIRAIKRNFDEKSSGRGVLRIEFVGTGRALEEKLIDGAGYKRHVVELKGLVGRGVTGVLEFITSYPKAFVSVWRLISAYRPDVVIGVGGYASFLPVFVARLRGIPTWIHEAEVNPGLTNLILSFLSTRVSVGFDRSSIWWRKVLHLGHPVREELAYVTPIKADIQPMNVLLLGGSQGAAALDQAMIELSPFLKEQEIRLVHQTRPENLEKVRNAYVAGGVSAEVISFIDDMVAAYSKADIIISRAGAASVTEIGIVNRPAIFVPLPSSQGGHQLVNARYLVDRGKALLVVEGEGFPQRLKDALSKLLNRQIFKEIVERPFDRRSVSAASDIAKGCLKLIKSPILKA